MQPPLAWELPSKNADNKSRRHEYLAAGGRVATPPKAFHRAGYSRSASVHRAVRRRCHIASGLAKSPGVARSHCYSPKTWTFSEAMEEVTKIDVRSIAENKCVRPCELPSAGKNWYSASPSDFAFPLHATKS